MDWIEILLEEYKTLRTESLESIKSQQTTLNIGTTIAGGIVIAGFNLWNETIVPVLIFLIFIPTLCYLILLIWLGEVIRMTRAGIYLKKIEDRVSKKFPNKKPPLNFENWLRNQNKNGKSKQNKWNYISVIAMFMFVAFSSILIGNYKLYINKIFEIRYYIIINFFEFLALILMLKFVYSTSRKLK